MLQVYWELTLGICLLGSVKGRIGQKEKLPAMWLQVKTQWIIQRIQANQVRGAWASIVSVKARGQVFITLYQPGTARGTPPGWSIALGKADPSVEGSSQ